MSFSLFIGLLALLQLDSIGLLPPLDDLGMAGAGACNLICRGKLLHNEVRQIGLDTHGFYEGPGDLHVLQQQRKLVAALEAASQSLVQPLAHQKQISTLACGTPTSVRKLSFVLKFTPVPTFITSIIFLGSRPNFWPAIRASQSPMMLAAEV